MKHKDIEHAYKIAAKIVAMYGDTYLPVFERMHVELAKQRQDLSIKSLALQVASDVKMPCNKEKVEPSIAPKFEHSKIMLGSKPLL